MTVPPVSRRLLGFRPRPGPTLVALPILAVLVGLGLWQLDRRDEKAALIDRIESRMAAEPVALPASIVDPADWDYRRVVVRGDYRHDRPLYLTGRTHRGRVGVDVVVPLRLAEPGGGAGHILVNRGWLPTDGQRPDTAAITRPAGDVVVEGVLRLPGERGWMQPDNEPDNNRWFWIDIPAMADAAALPGAAPLLLDAAAGQHAGDYPVGGRTRVNLPDNHLQYAITWFGLAAALLAVYVIFHRRPPKAGRAPPNVE